MGVDRITVRIKRFPGNDDLALPTYQSDGAAAMDICAAVKDAVVIQPRERIIIPTGFAVAVPTGFEAQIRPRSGLAAIHGISVLNSPGTVDPDYRGEIKVLLVNHAPEPFTITRGMRIAQILIVPVPFIEWQEVEELPPSKRSEGGFGHTGN
jgi:dUTP diphosphatase